MPLLLLKDLPRYECLLEAAREFPALDPSATEAFLHLLRCGDEAFRVVTVSDGQQALDAMAATRSDIVLAATTLPGGVKTRLPLLPFQMFGWRPPLTSDPPEIGQHNEEVLGALERLEHDALALEFAEQTESHAVSDADDDPDGDAGAGVDGCDEAALGDAARDPGRHGACARS